MSTQPKISDDEMRYFQFKARQLFLLKKEDHEWNEFCKKSTCDCQLCQGGMKISKEIGIQASPRGATSTLRRNQSNTAGYQSRTLPTALSEIKFRLEKIDSALSQMNITSDVTKEVVNEGVPEVKLLCSSGTDELTWNPLNERRMQIIRNSLKASLQRLQSNVIQKARSAPSISVKTKNSGFFLPPDLQVKRAASRRAYLASLSKKNQIPAKALSKNENKKGTLKQNTQIPTAPPKFSKKTVLKSKKEGEDKVETLVASEGLTESKDENIENAVDGILDDLMGETVLVINKIKQIKSGELSSKNVTSAVLKKPSIPKSSVENETRVTGLYPPGNWEKVRQNLLHLKTQCEKHNVNCDENTGVNIESLQSRKECRDEKMGDVPPAHDSQSENTLPKRVEVLEHKPYTSNYKARELTISPKVAKETEKSRKEYWKYLDRISRTKKGNFDPWMLSNMVAESLLDDCIAEVALELQDVPNNLFTDLYNQEFLQSI